MWAEQQRPNGAKALRRRTSILARSLRSLAALLCALIFLLGPVVTLFAAEHQTVDTQAADDTSFDEALDLEDDVDEASTGTPTRTVMHTSPKPEAVARRQRSEPADPEGSTIFRPPRV